MYIPPYITKDEPKAATLIARKIDGQDRSLYKPFAKGEDVIYDQLVQALGTISEFCLPSLLRILIKWYHHQSDHIETTESSIIDQNLENIINTRKTIPNDGTEANNSTTPATPATPSSPDINDSSASLTSGEESTLNTTTMSPTNTNSATATPVNPIVNQLQQPQAESSLTSYAFSDRRLLIEYTFCQALIEIFSQLSLHPGYEDLIEQIQDIAFSHFKHIDNKTVLPGGEPLTQSDVVNLNNLADKYAEVIGVLTQTRFKLVRKRFILELNKLRAEESDKKIQSIVALLSGIRHFRVKMAPIEDFDSSMQFLQELGDYFLEVRHKSIKHALAGLFVEIMIPLAASVKNEVKIPSLRNFVDTLWTQTLDMSTRKKHTTILFPLVTCLLCLSQRSFFLANWNIFLNMCLSNLKNRDQKMCRIALDSLYRLIWIYMIRIRGESNNVTHNRLQLIVDALFPRNSRQIVPRDAPLGIFIDMIHFIAQERLDFAMRHIIFDLLSVERPCKVIVAPERINIGLQAFIMIANSLQHKEAEPIMPRCLLSSMSAASCEAYCLSSIRRGSVIMNKILTEEGAKSIGLNMYYPTIQKAFNDILRALNNQLGKPYLLTNTPQLLQQPTNTPPQSNHQQNHQQLQNINNNNSNTNSNNNNNNNNNHQINNNDNNNSHCNSLSLSLSISGGNQNVNQNNHNAKDHHHLDHDHILHHHHHQLEHSLSSLTASSLLASTTLSNDRKPKIELLRTCIRIIPRLLPDGMSKEELIEFLARMTIHVDETIRKLAVETFKTLVSDFVDWRLEAIEGFTLFLINHLDESSQRQLVDNSLRILLDFLHCWQNAISLQSTYQCQYEQCQGSNDKQQQHNTSSSSSNSKNQQQSSSKDNNTDGRLSSLCNHQVINSYIQLNNQNGKSTSKNGSIRSTNTVVSIQTGFETISSRQSGPVGQIAARKSRALAEMRLIQSELTNIPFHRLISVLQKLEGASLMMMCSQDETTRHLASHLLAESRAIILCYASWTRMDQFGFKSHGELDLDEEDFLTSIKGSLSDDKLSSQISAISGSGPLECTADFFPSHVIILLTHLLSNYDDPSTFSLNIARRIAIWCEENQSAPERDLENLATVMNLYSRRSFSKDAFQWTKCVVKYLLDAFPDSIGSTIPLAIDLLENGPERIQQLVAPILYCLFTYVDPMAQISTPSYPMESLNQDLMRIYAKYLSTSQWPEALQIFKLIISRSSSLTYRTGSISGSSFSRELPGRTLDFMLDVNFNSL